MGAHVYGPEFARRKLYRSRWLRFVGLIFIGVLSIVVIATIMRGQLIWVVSVLSGAVGRPLFKSTQQQDLRFTAQGTFQITIFNDLHFGEGEDNRK
jgi:hypothetical protein